MEMEELPKTAFSQESKDSENKKVQEEEDDLPQTQFVSPPTEKFDNINNQSDNNNNNNQSAKPDLHIDVSTLEEQNLSEKTLLEKTKEALSKIIPALKKVHEQVTGKESAFRIHLKEFTREFSIWTFAVMANILLSFFSWDFDQGTGAGALSGIFGLVFAGIQFISLVHMFSAKSKFVLLKHLGSAAGKSELSAPNLLELAPLLIFGGLLIAFQIAHNAVVEVVWPITMFQIIIVFLGIFFRYIFPTVMMEREGAIFPNWPKGSLRYRQMVGREYFDPELINAHTDQAVEQGRGYFKKERTRCGCLVATDEIQITTDRVSLVSTYKGNFWNCCKPDHQEYTDAWLSKSPGLSVREPEVICCCCSYVVPLSPVSAVKIACFGMDWCSAMDDMGVYTHTPCTPSRHLVVGQEGIGLLMKVAIDPKDEQIIVNTFYEATQKYNHKPEENGAKNYEVPVPNIMIGFPPNKYQSNHYKQQ